MSGCLKIKSRFLCNVSVTVAGVNILKSFVKTKSIYLKSSGVDGENRLSVHNIYNYYYGIKNSE